MSRETRRPVRALGVLGAAIESLEGRVLLSGMELLADIRPGTAGSDPGSFVVADTQAFFLANDQAHGYQLWRTDGTPAGTRMVVDLGTGAFTGSAGLDTAIIGDTLYFVSRNQLYRTDGTEAGTLLLYDFGDPTGTARARELTALGDAVFFGGYSGSAWSLWRTDGTPQGTASFRSGSPRDLAVAGGLLFFGVGFYPGVYVSDGTVAGTRGIVLYPPENGLINPDPMQHRFSGFAEFGGTVYFAVNGNHLWHTDGTEAGTSDVPLEHGALSEMGPLTVAGDRLFFTATSSIFGAELWTIDRADPVARLVGDLAPGMDSPDVCQMVAVGTDLYFTSPTGWTTKLWKTDGTAAGTVRLDLAAVKDIHALMTVGGSFAMLASGASGSAAWLDHGAGGGIAAIGTWVGLSNAVPFGDGLLVAAPAMATGTEVYRLDPTPSLIADAGPSRTIAEGQTVVLTARAFPAGAEIVKYEWDVNPTTAFTAEATGPTFSVACPDGPATINVALRATDSAGNVHIDTARISVTDVAPTLGATGPSEAQVGQAVRLALSASDPGQDALTAWQINWGDGSTSDLPGDARFAEHVYTSSARMPIGVVAANEDGRFTLGKRQVGVADPTLGDGSPKWLRQPGAVVPLPDGRFILAGGTLTVSVTRHNADGSLDPSFGDGGITYVHTDTRDRAVAAALQGDGKLVVACSPGDHSIHDWVVMRFTADGRLDEGFGAGGIVRLHPGAGKADDLADLAVLPDGRIVLGGSIDRGSNIDDMAVARLLPDGRLDTSFGTGGWAFLDLGGDDRGVALAVDADGRIVLAGHTIAGSKHSLVVARYLDDGTPDLWFGEGGYARADSGWGKETAGDVVLQEDGRIIVAGSIFSGSFDYYALARFRFDGQLDSSFGVDGWAAEKLLSRGWGVLRKAILCNGRIIAAGGDTPTAASIRVWGFSPDGTRDPAFSAGVNLFEFASDGIATGMARTETGSLLVAGQYGVAVRFDVPAVAFIATITQMGDIIAGSTEVAEGQPAVLYSGVDEWGGRQEWTVERNGQVVATGAGTPFSFVPSDDGQYAVHLVATDRVGAITIEDALLNVTNVPPSASVTGAASSYPGVAYTLSILPPADPGDDAVSQYIVDWGDGQVEAFATPGAKKHTYGGPSRALEIRLALVDEDGDHPDVATHALVLDPPIGNVQGTVYRDLDGDGLRDAGEPGLQNWRIYVDADGDGAFDIGEASALSAASGGYALAGVPAGPAMVRAAPPAGWVLLHPAGGWDVNVVAGQTQLRDFAGGLPGSLSGLVYHDLNGDGARQAGEPGLGNRIVFLDANGNGAFDSSEYAARTSAAGSYRFDNIAPGTCRLGIVPEAWQITTQPAPLAAQAGQTVAASAFGLSTLGILRGELYEDANGNNARDEGEGILDGRVVYIDADGNGLREAGEAFTTTDAGGAWSFSVQPGLVAIACEGSAGWRAGAAQQVQAVSGQEGVTALGLAPVASVAGLLYHDRNGDGRQAAGDPPLSGRAVYLDEDGDSVQDASEPVASTDESGHYLFGEALTTSLRVLPVAMAGWRTSAGTPAAPSAGPGDTVGGGDFALTQSALVSGTVFADANGNRRRDAREKLLKKKRVYLDLDKDGRWDRKEPSALTNAKGVFSLKPIQLGRYVLRIAAPATTLPRAGSYKLSLSPARIVPNRDFGV